MASIAAFAVTGAGLVAFAGTASAASTAPAWEPDTGSALGSTGYGQIVFYDAHGNVVTSGNDLNNPFAYAVGATPKDAGVTFTQLIFANPQSGVLTANWTALNQTSSIIANITGAPADVQSLIATNPVVAAGTQASIFNYEATEYVDPTAGYGHVLQIRETDSGPNQAGNSGTGNYWESDVAFNNTSAPITVLGVTLAPGTWQQLFPTVTTTTTSLTTNAPSGGVTPGTAIKLTATTNDTSAAGSFNFYDGTTLIGSAPAASGSGSFTYTPSATENASFTASFVPTLGDIQNPNTANATMVSSSTSAPVSVNVGAPKTGTSVSVTASSTSITLGDPDTLTATVTESDSPTTAGLAGSVEFFSGTTSLGKAATNASGVATLTTTKLPLGSDSITATFTPTDTADYGGSTSSAATVNVVSPASLTLTNPQVAPGSDITVNGGGCPSGTLTVTIGGLAPQNVTTNADGTWTTTFTAPKLQPGAYPVTVSNITCTGLATPPSYPKTAVIVTQPTDTVTASTIATNGTFTASGTACGSATSVDVSLISGTGAVEVPQTVTSDSTGKWSAPIDLSSSPLPVGSYSLAATCDLTGDTFSYPMLTEVIKATPTVTVTAPASAVYGGAYNVTVSVTTGTTTLPEGTPSGTVTLLANGATIATGTLASGSHTFALKGTERVPGNTTFSVKYAGDTQVLAATSAGKTTAVKAATSSVAPTWPSRVTFGTAYRVPVRVTASTANAVPSGTATLYYGSTVLGRAALAGTARTTSATISVSAALATKAPAGTRTLRVVYSGKTGVTTSSVSHNEAVAKASSKVTARPATSSPVKNVADKIAITVTSPGNIPTGTVTIKNGAAIVGRVTLRSGKATFSIRIATTGTHTITVSYGGSGNVNASKATFQLAVRA